MNKMQWIEHIKETEGIIPPSQGGSKGDWDYAISIHKSMNCPQCKDRARTRKATINHKIREEAYKSAGLVKVYGAVSGKVYWE